MIDKDKSDDKMTDESVGGTSDSRENPPAVFFRFDNPTEFNKEIDYLATLGFADCFSSYAVHMLRRVSIIHLEPYIKKVISSQTPPTLECVHDLVTIDRRFQAIVFKYIGIIEAQLRAQYSRLMALENGAFGLYDPASFFNEKQYKTSLRNAEKEADRRSKRDRRIEKRLKRDDGRIPLGYAVECMSFGTLSRFITNTRSSQVRNGISKSFGIDYFQLKSWMRSLAVLRNTCAHFDCFLALPQDPMPPVKLRGLEYNNQAPFSIAIVICRFIAENSYFKKSELNYSYRLWRDLRDLLDEAQEEMPEALSLIDVPKDFDVLMSNASIGQILAQRTISEPGFAETIEG